MTYTLMTVDEVVQYFAETRKKPIQLSDGTRYEGDIFYSDIYIVTKRQKADFFAVVDKLRRLGYWVHS